MCCCNNCNGNGNGSGSGDLWVCYCSRYATVPMRVYDGPGVTLRDLAEESNASLRSIANTLERSCTGTGVSNGNSCCCGSGYNYGYNAYDNSGWYGYGY